MPHRERGTSERGKTHRERGRMRGTSDGTERGTSERGKTHRERGTSGRCGRHGFRTRRRHSRPHSERGRMRGTSGTRCRRRGWFRRGRSPSSSSSSFGWCPRPRRRDPAARVAAARAAALRVGVFLARSGRRIAALPKRLPPRRIARRSPQDSGSAYPPPPCGGSSPPSPLAAG